MTIQDIYNLAVKRGIEFDPRGNAGVKRALERTKKAHQLLSAQEKQYYDDQSLSNPYSDTRILFGDPQTFVNKVLVGIDISVGELLLADRLNQKGEGIDLVIAHHPAGRALAALDEVMELQIDMMEAYGVPVHIADNLMRNRIDEVYRRFAPLNHHQATDAARLITMPLMCIHTPTDNIGWHYLSSRIENKLYDTLADVINELNRIEELHQAQTHKAGPVIFLGSPRSRAGKVSVVEFTGGTEGAKELYEHLSRAGIGTVIAMHVSEEHRKEAEKHHMNLVVTGHMASDSLGINILMDELERNGVLVIPCSGYMRVKR